ncbi:hypothetical protein WJX74_000071 [Apatococcus lobatus]|uniref:Tetratricopeptide repeat protein n=1 Tax=Apatococcus lobatus TaxID=904363 RepID=A0AAW1RCU1_9CHLO
MTGVSLALTIARPGQAKQALRPGVTDIPVSDQIKFVKKLTDQAEEAARDGKFEQALSCHDEIVHRFPDLAITEYARIHRAIFLYQIGNASRAILELEDEEANLRGFAEVHAALACILHAERPREVGRAESQWEIASEFDTRFGDIQWVQAEKHWPPRLLAALQSFLNLA